MQPNVGGLDRTIRIVLGLFLLGMAFFRVLPGAGSLGAFLLGTVAIVTGIARYCPAWSMFGIDTHHPGSAA